MKPDVPVPLRQWWRQVQYRGRVLMSMVLLTVFGIAQRLVPMSRWSRILGRATQVPTEWRGQKIERLPLRSGSLAETRVADAIARATRALPWTPTCLAEAAAGQTLLRLARSPGVVVIGLRPTDLTVRDAWDAHAWLLGTCGALTGGPAAQGFTATTVYEVPGALRAGEIDLSVTSRSD